jgi:hypothetical protein
MKIVQSNRVVSPKEEQQSIDVYKGIGNPGEAGPHRTQKDVTVPNDVVHAPSSTTRM